MRDELGENIMKESFGLKPKAYSYFIDGSNKDKKAKESNS